MFIVDDPILALIVRFAVRDREINGTDEAFLRRQVETLKQYLKRFPESEHGDKVIEWIAEYAAEYRLSWQRQVVSRQAGKTRCRDCPMNTFGEDVFCQVHYKWMELLRRYSRDEMNSIEYVKAALQMLRQHKRQLVIRKRHEAEERRQLRAYRAARNRPL
ncbi:hypothetical protein [Sedimenticola sp.]|uniref:hypothetical protein n=1 Tax=Sedimenticola sp. TaxID=1940285 RepID=UPI003D10E2A3